MTAINDLYTYGQQLGEQYKNMREAIRHEDDLMHYDAMSLAVIEAGLMGNDTPTYVTGWRYGHIPACGQSYNARDQRLEMGVSVMEIDGGAKTQDMLAAMFYSNRPIVKVAGWLNTVKTGADGEPLLLWCKEI